MKKIILLGATGSVGSSVLSVIQLYPEKFQLIGFSAWENINKTIEIIKTFHPKYVVLKNKHDELPLLFPKIHFFYEEEGLINIVEVEESNTVVCAIFGIAGLLPCLQALKKGKNLITANKESIVSGGTFLKKAAKKHGSKIIPLDSEHIGILDLIGGKNREDIKEFIITASGGPFLYRKIDSSITIDEVLKHPTWQMGRTITVGSALMINKGLEIIEAMHLFDIPESKIRVLIHPQSLVHAAIEMNYGHWHFLASPTDMRYSALYGLFFPDSPKEAPFGNYDPVLQPLEFLDPDYDKFRLLAVARNVARAGGLLPTVLCSVMEVVIEQFLAGNIKFYKIPDVIQEIIEQFPHTKNPELEEILIADKKSKILALQRITFHGDDLR